MTDRNDRQGAAVLGLGTESATRASGFRGSGGEELPGHVSIVRNP